MYCGSYRLDFEVFGGCSRLRIDLDGVDPGSYHTSTGMRMGARWIMGLGLVIIGGILMAIGVDEDFPPDSCANIGGASAIKGRMKVMVFLIALSGFCCF